MDSQAPPGSQPLDTSSQRDARLPYLPGLDGLRALAVIAVVLYHAGLPLLGGFLGVETFFTLSGFLITALLMTEWHAAGRIDLKSFWIRRARRLIPALMLLLAGTLTYAAIALPDEMAALQGDAFAALVYLMNWHLIAGGQSYFDPTLRPSLFQHLWSLSVEEQFYLAWPPLFILGMRFLRPRWLLALVLLVAAASVTSMVRMYDPGSDPSRIYYGTDTRAAGLLLGVAFGLVWMPWRTPEGRTRRPGVLFDLLGIVALVALIGSYWMLNEQHPWLYRGGFVLVALATVAAIAGVTHPQARLLPVLLRWSPLRWFGTRSYSIYLWHWPVFQVTRPYQDLALDGLPLFALRVGITLVLAEISYRWVELPARHGAIGRVAGKLRTALVPAANPALGIVASSSHRRAKATQMVQRTLYMRNVKQSGALAMLSVCALSLSSSACAFEAPLAANTPSAAVALASTSLPATTIAQATAIIAAQATPTSAITATNAATATAASTATSAATATAASTATSAATATSEATATPEKQTIDPALAAELQRVLDQLVASGSIPGAVAAINIPGYETWVGASGVMNRKSGEAMQPDTRTRIASISKMFTAVTVLQLVEEGKIALDEPVESYLPGLLKNGSAITVRQLLSHTSGLYDFLENRTYVNQAYREPERVFEPAELVAYAEKFPASFKPGANNAWDYSSTNYVILGMIVEQVTGNTMAEEERQRIYEPLGLEATFFTPYEEVEGSLANGYSNAVDQSKVAMTFGFATANIVATTEDVNRFGQALFAGELLQPETMNEMQTFVGGKGQYNMPELAYGLGVMRNQLPVGNGADGAARTPEEATVLGHIGGFGGFRSALWHAPESGVTISLGVNQGATDPNMLATRLFDAVLTAQGQ